MTLTQINRAGLDAAALDRVFTIGASGSSAYTFQGEGLNGTVNNPTLYLTRGKTYRFVNASGGHPIRIQSTSGASGTAYNTGVTNNAGSGTVIVEVQHDAPDVLYYQCTSHAAMNGILYITGALPDGGVTTAKIANGAVTTTKINASAVVTDSLATDAVTGAKIADNAIDSEHYTDGSIDTAHIGTGQVTGAKLAAGAVSEASKIADSIITGAKIGSGTITDGNLATNSVTTAKIATNAITNAKIGPQAVTLSRLENGTSSNDGKFLRANNGSSPTFETVSSDLVNDTSPQLGGDLDTNSFEISLDDAHAVKFGASEDLQIYHEGGGGDNIIKNNVANKHLKILHNDGSAAAVFYNNTSVELFNAGSNKFGTTSNGIKVIGAADAGGGSTSGNIQMVATSGRKNTIGNSFATNSTDSRIEFGVSDGSTSGGTNRVASISYAGISFGSDTSSANRLDDYEEGSWTPTMVNTGSLSNGVASGRYTKIGRMVHFVAYLSWSARSNNGNYNIKFQSLPFTCASYFRFPIYVGGQEGFTDDNGNTTHIAGSVLANTTEGQFRVSSSDAHNEVSFTGGSGSTGSGYIYWGGTYYIN